jgi:hypothetical protein
MARRPAVRKSDLSAAYAFASEHGLTVRALRCLTDGGFVFDSVAPVGLQSSDPIDRELAALEARHGEG